MNEQLIKKLWHQAGATVSPLKTGGEWQKDFVQAYTELIVKECAEISDNLAKLYPRTDVGFDVGYTMGTTRAAKEIKQHFGVEE